MVNGLRGVGMTPRALHSTCFVIMIKKIYGLGVGISTINKINNGYWFEGGGDDPPGHSILLV